LATGRRRRLARGHRPRRRRLLEHHADRPALELGHPRHDRDRAGADRELAGLLEAIAVRVAELVEPIDQLLLGHRLTAAQLERPRQDAREHRRPLAVEPVVDHFREPHVVIRGDGQQQDGGDGENRRGDPHPAFSPDRGDTNREAGPGRVRR
jgi:hypothetical protein